MGQNIDFSVIARDKASSTFSRIARSSEATERRLIRFGRTAAGMVGFSTLTTAAVGFVKVGSQYTGALNKIQALTGITDDRLKKTAATLESQSGQYAKMGQTTGDAAEGMVELTKAGMGVGRSLKSVAATMVLAKAGGLAVADSAGLVSNALNVWRKDNLTAGAAANVLANAANISSADVSDLAQSLQMASNVAASAGASFAETNAMLAMLSNAGMKGSDAGTSLKTMLLSLQAPSSTAAKGLKAIGVNAFDSAGKARPLRAVLADLDGKFKDLTDQERAQRLKQIFGTDAYRAARVIFGQHVKQYDEYVKKVNKAGAAQKLAEANSKGFTGSLKKLRAEVISAGQAAYRDLEPSLDSAAKKLSEFVQGMRSGEGAGGDFANVVKELATVAKAAVKIIDALPSGVTKFAVQGLLAYTVLRKLQGATGGWGTSLTGTMARVKQFGAEMTYTATRTQRLQAASAAASGAVRNLAGAGGLMMLTASAGASNKSTATLMQTLGGAATGFAMGGPVGAAVGGLAGLMLGLSTNTGKSADAARDSITVWQAYTSTLDDATAAVTKQTAAQAQEIIRKKNLNKVLDDYGYTNRQIVDAIVKGGPLRQKMIADLKAEEAARARVGNEIVRKHGASSQEWKDFAKSNKARADAVTTTLAELGAVTAAVKAKRQDIAATRTFSKVIKDLPERTEVYVRAAGLKPGISGVVELARQIKLTPKEIRILLRENGIKPTKENIQQVIDRARELGRMKPVVNVGASTGKARGELSSFYQYLLSVTKPRTVDVRVRSGKPGGVGSLLGQTNERTGGGSNGRVVGEMRGAATQTMKVRKALEKFGATLSTVTSKLGALRDTRAGFLSTFQSDSIFSADMTTGGGVGSLIQFQTKQAQQAAQLFADVQRVAAMGLSKSLISQLQAQGTSGAMQLHALASGGPEQIRLLNALNAQTQASLQAAGMLAGNTVRGGNINADIAAAARQEQTIERLIKRLRKMDEEIVVEIDGEAIIRAIKRRNKRKGVRTAGL